MANGRVELPGLETFKVGNLITDVLSVVKSGKEATVYCCEAHPSTGREYLAAKVYRPLEQRSFQNNAVYRHGRNAMETDKRRARAMENNSRRGHVMRFASWIEYEYNTLALLHAAGADVPEPVRQNMR